MTEGSARREVGRYRIVKPIGEGGMGVVYEAVDTASGETVALKQLREVDQGRADRRLRFAREAKLAEAITHPGIVRVREVVEAGEELFIAMDLVVGVSLRARLDALRDRGATLEVSEALRIARAVAEAVAHAHTKGVIHRDLKPENVMLAGADDDVRVLDFGLAKLREIEGGVVYDAETESSVTQEGHVLGTPAYMAPEQARGREVGFRADVFSLGVMLYEMLVGQRPFVGTGTIDLIVAITRDDPPPPSTKNPLIAPEIDALVLGCLAKKAEARPTMEELARSLGNVAGGSPGTARVGPRRRLRVVAVAVLGAAVVAGSFLGIRSHRNVSAAAAPVPASASAMPTAITALPMPTSSVAEAVDAYRTAVQDERDGAEDAALLELDRATKKDPDLAAAHLRLAVRLAFIEAENARTHFARAVAARDRLTARDMELLDAMRPVFQRDPPDVQAWATGVEALANRHPGDAELALEVAKARDAMGDFHGSEEAAAHAVSLDGRFALALATLAQEQAYLGDFSAAEATISKCRTVSASASWCLWVGEFMDGQAGRCEANEKSARDRIAVDPTIPDGYKALAYSLAALGRPETAVREASDQAVLRTPEGFPRQRLSLNMAVRMDAMVGRFESAEGHLDELRALLTTRADKNDHAMPTWIAADVEVEMGHDARAGSIAKDFLDRKDVWQANPVPNDYAIANDLTPALLAVARRAGALPQADFDAAMRTWRERWAAALHGDWSPYLWVYGYAAVAQTPEEGKAAVDALATFGPIPPFLVDGDLPEAAVGHALWLGGRAAEAIVHLKRAASSCDVVTHPLPWVRSHAWLGDALAATGDTKGACEAYALVVSRWGQAPHSVTASHAKDAIRQLKCDTPR